MLKTDFLGIKMKNPVIVAAGPWNRDGRSMREFIAAGAGAVVTESIVSDTTLDLRPHISCDGQGAQNIRLYSDIQIEGWERELAIAKADGGVVIASISGHSPSELAYMASKMEKFGADAIELSVSNPAVEALEVVASNADTVSDMTREIVSAVGIPVIVKLSQNTTNISKVAKAVKEAGASGVTAINTVRGILGVDVENCTPSLSMYGGISGEYIRPLGLASVATIAQTVNIPICGVGGISSAENVLEYMMLGASAVQIGTHAMLKGKEAVSEVIQNLENWTEEHGLKNIGEVRGKALKNLKSFDEMKFEPATSRVESTPCSENCDICISSCFHNAIRKKDGNVDVNRNRCTGCGLCISLCPAKKLKLGI